MSIEVEYVGGPYDGRRTRIDGDPLDPPGTLPATDVPQSAGESTYFRTTHAELVWRYVYSRPAA